MGARSDTSPYAVHEGDPNGSTLLGLSVPTFLRNMTALTAYLAG